MYHTVYDFISIEEDIIVVGGKNPDGITGQADIWGLDFMDTSTKLNTYYDCNIPKYPYLVYGTTSTLVNNSFVCNHLLGQSEHFSPNTYFHSMLEICYEPQTFLTTRYALWTPN